MVRRQFGDQVRRVARSDLAAADFDLKSHYGLHQRLLSVCWAGTTRQGPVRSQARYSPCRRLSRSTAGLPFTIAEPSFLNPDLWKARREAMLSGFTAATTRATPVR